MNPYLIKEEIDKKVGQKVKITVYGMRNKTTIYEGIIKHTYPHLFTVYDGKVEKSFNYRDIITGDIKIKYK